MTNCVYIFGNGFDIRMGMPTSYPDFLKYYQNIKAPNDSIISIKEMFLSKVKEEKGEHWKDLEVALGLFTNEFSNKQLFKSFYRDINIELRKYLTQVEKNIPFFSDNDRDKFWKDLQCPEYYLHLDSEKSLFNEFISKDEVNADIISFNYTKTIESLLVEKVNKKNNDPFITNPFTIKSIKHIHGLLNKSNILFGVNDVSQIANIDFQNDESIQDLIIKPKANLESGTFLTQECVSLIQHANVFYIYGTSLGPTDQYWWDWIGDRFRRTSNSVIVYFDYKRQGLEDRMLDIEYISLERDVRKRIMKTMNIQGNERDYRNRIYVACNREIFPTYPKRDIFL